MPKSLPFDLRSRVFAAIDAGLSCRRAAARFAVSASSAIRWQALRRLGGDGRPKPQELPVVLSHKKLDANPRLLGVLNGAIELDTGTFRPGRRDDCTSMQCGVACDSKAACPEWIKFQEFICGLDRELIAYKKRKAGVATPIFASES